MAGILDEVLLWKVIAGGVVVLALAFEFWRLYRDRQRDREWKMALVAWREAITNWRMQAGSMADALDVMQKRASLIGDTPKSQRHRHAAAQSARGIRRTAEEVSGRARRLCRAMDGILIALGDRKDW